MRRRQRYDWEDDVREVRTAARYAGLSVAGWIIVAVIFSIALSALIWFLRVQTSEVKGAGDAQIITNDGQNRINAQEGFHKLYQQIVALDRQITESGAQLAAATTPEDRKFHRDTLAGQTSRCLQVVGSYDAETNLVSRAKWRDPNLPYKIDQTDPATDCRPNAVPSPAR